MTMFKQESHKMKRSRPSGSPFCLVLALPIALGLGCAEPQRPYQFTTSQMARDPIEALAAAMTQASQTPVVVDPQTGNVNTRWVDTGVRSGTVQGREATIVRRYSAKLVHGAFGNDVALSANTQRCAVGGFVLTELNVEGTCVPMEHLLPEHKEELMRLGQR